MVNILHLSKRTRTVLTSASATTPLKEVSSVQATAIQTELSSAKLRLTSLAISKLSAVHYETLLSTETAPITTENQKKFMSNLSLRTMCAGNY